MSPKYRRQNRNVCDLVLIFSQNQRLFFLEVKLYRSPSFQVLWSLPWQDQAVFNFLGRFQGHIVCGCWQALNHASIALVTKYRQLAHLNTTFNDEKFFLIAIKILRLKRSLSWGHNLRKRIVLVLLTAVDLRRSIMCAAWPDNICLESTSLPPKGFQEVLLISITIFISSYLHFFFLQMQVFRRYLSLSIKIIYDHVLRDKKKEPAMFWSANFPRLPRQFTYILNNFRLSKREREWIKISLKEIAALTRNLLKSS